jgi:hypothetical protein
MLGCQTFLKNRNEIVKIGIRFTGLASSITMAIGTGINYWALIHTFPEGSMIFGLKTQVFMSAIGFSIWQRTLVLRHLYYYH